MTFPRRWDAPNWKQKRDAVKPRRKPIKRSPIKATFKKAKGPTAKRREAKHRRLAAQERVNKAAVRRRDGPTAPTVGRCRFPLCGCHGMAVFEGSPAFVEVSHGEHKGMGGDPTGERSRPELMLCVCAWRHKSGRYAIDKGTLRWVPLTEAGANGPVAWEMRLPGTGLQWWELARESAVQQLAPVDPRALPVLHDLARMID